MIKILLVDDEKIERDALRLIINKGVNKPIHIEEATNGREALSLFQSFGPDIVFMDIKMPGINGLEAAKTIRSQNSDTRIVFITAFHEFDYAHEAIRIGVDDYLIKPSSEAQIVSLVEKMVSEVDVQRREKNQAHTDDLRLSALTEHLAQEFVYHLFLRGIEKDKFANYLSLLSIPFVSGYGGILELDYESYPIRVESEYQKKILQRRCASVITAEMKRQNHLCYWNFDLSDPYFLLALPREPTIDGQPTDLLHQIQERIRHEFTIQARIYLGPEFSEPSQALRSYARARRNTSPIPRSKRLLKPGFEDQVKHSLLQSDKEAFQTLLDELVTGIRESEQDYLSLRTEIVDLSRVLNHFFTSRLAGGGDRISDEALLVAPDQTALIAQVTVFFRELYGGIETGIESRSSQNLDPLLAYLGKNFHRDLSLEQAASMARLSAFHFTKVFKQVTGTTYVDYLTRLRIEEASYLLENTPKSITEVAEAVGYRDPNYFSRVYKKWTGHPPTKIRSKIIQIPQNNPDSIL